MPRSVSTNRTLRCWTGISMFIIIIIIIIITSIYHYYHYPYLSIIIILYYYYLVLSYILLGWPLNQISSWCFELPRVHSLNFEFPQVHHGKWVWNRPVLLLLWNVRTQNGKLCWTFLKILFLWSQMDVMYFTRHVVAWHATCQSPIGLLGGNMLTRGILTRGIFWSDGPRLPSRNLPRRNDKLWKSRFVIFVFPRFHVWSPVFLFLESAFFFICLSRPQDCSDCDLELQTVSLAELSQHPGKFLREWAGLLSFWSDGPRDFKTKTQNKC
jgi:hypothetical protein